MVGCIAGFSTTLLGNVIRDTINNIKAGTDLTVFDNKVETASNLGCVLAAILVIFVPMDISTALILQSVTNVCSSGFDMFNVRWGQKLILNKKE